MASARVRHVVLVLLAAALASAGCGAPAGDAPTAEVARPQIALVMKSLANDNMALGALAARRQSGRDDVLIVGFDHIDAVAELVDQCEILATADQHADRLAVFGIEAALEILGGGEAEDRQTPVDLIAAPTDG